MKKILMIAPEPFFQPRGTPFSVLNRIRALSRLGHKVDLVTYPIGQDIKIKNFRIFRSMNLGFKNVKIGPSFKKIALDILLFFTVLRRLVIDKYEIIHTHEESVLFGVIFKKLFSVKLVYDMHSSLPQQIQNYSFSDSRPILAFFQNIERFAINNADVVITICPHLDEVVMSMNKKATSIIIENVDLSVVSRPSNSALQILRRKYSMGKEKKLVVYTGNLEKNQGIDLLIQSIQKVVEKNKNVVLLIVGGAKEHIEKYSNMAANLGIHKNVIFTGQRPSQEVPAFLKLADILVSPRTIGTNTPLKIYSYLESGKPIVATDIFSHTQVLNDRIAVLAKPTPSAFAKGILKLLNNLEKGRMISKNAKFYAEKNYSHKSFINKTKRMIELCVE